MYLIYTVNLSTNMQLPKLGLVLFTFGNVSAADRELGVFAIKPSGIPYDELTTEKMVIVDFDGHVVLLFVAWVDLTTGSGARQGVMHLGG